MKISVVMATYNGARFLEQQLQSLVAQSRPPDELVICDDRSEDDTIAVARRATTNAPFPVTIVENPERLGYADNFLTAAARARGDYIAFCDQDDVWLPNKLATYAGWIETYPDTALFIHRGKVVDEALNPMEAYHPNVAATVLQAPRTAKLTARPPGFAMCFKRGLIADFDWRNRPQDLEFPGTPSKHDTWIATLADTTGGVYYSTEDLVLYRRHGKNYSYFRKGSNFSRRLGQMRDALAPPRAEGLRTLREGLRQHAAFFEQAASQHGGTLREQAARYRAAAAKIEARLSLLDAGRRRSVGLLMGNLRLGYYRQGGRLDRRALAQDAAVAFRNLLGAPRREPAQRST